MVVLLVVVCGGDVCVVLLVVRCYVCGGVDGCDVCGGVAGCLVSFVV